MALPPQQSPDPDTDQQPSDLPQQPQGMSGLEGLLVSSPDSSANIELPAINQQLRGQLYKSAQEGKPMPAVAWHSQEMRMAKMARPEVAKAIYDADRLVGIPPEMHFKIIAGIENQKMDPTIGYRQAGKGIGQVVDTTAKGVIENLAKTPEGRDIIAKADLTHYNTYNAYQNAVVSAAYIKDIMEKNRTTLGYQVSQNGIEFKTPEGLMRATTTTYLNYNVGPRDAHKIINAYNSGLTGMPMDKLDVAPISIMNNPSLYRGKTVGEAFEGIYRKLNIDVDPLMRMGRGEQPSPAIAANDDLKKRRQLPDYTAKRVVADLAARDAPKPGSRRKDEVVAGAGLKPDYGSTAAKMGAPVPGMGGPIFSGFPG